MTFKLVYCLLAFSASTFCLPHSRNHPYGNYESAIFPGNLTAKATTQGTCGGDVATWRAKSKADIQVNNFQKQQQQQQQSGQGVLSLNYNDLQTSEGKGECSTADDTWYYMFPFILYFLLILAAVGLFLILVHVTICLRRFLCPLIPLDVGICHRTTVTEEKQPDCRKKDKLQLSLVNVNKHYYKLEGHDGP